MDGGILYIDKEENMTSREVDNALQRLFHTRRVGHLGTLDPFATGLLIVAIGEATKCLPFYEDEDKTYVAELRLGFSTQTGDLTGSVKERKEVPELSKQRIEEVLSSFLGEYMQVPPMTSATRIEGKHLYELAHKGIEIKREAKKRFIYSLSLLDFEGEYVRFEAKVSKGTYIRTLGEDIAASLGTLGHLSSLRRTKIGEIGLEKAIRLDDVRPDCLKDPYLLLPFRKVLLSKEDSIRARNGVKLCFDYKEDTLFVCDNEGKAIAIYEREKERLYRVKRGIA